MPSAYEQDKARREAERRAELRRQQMMPDDASAEEAAPQAPEQAQAQGQTQGRGRRGTSIYDRYKQLRNLQRLARGGGQAAKAGGKMLGGGGVGGVGAGGTLGTTSTAGVGGGTIATGGTAATGGGTIAAGGTTAAGGGTIAAGGTTALGGGTIATGGTATFGGGTIAAGGTTIAVGGTAAAGGGAAAGGTATAGGTTIAAGGTAVAGTVAAGAATATNPVGWIIAAVILAILILIIVIGMLLGMFFMLCRGELGGSAVASAVSKIASTMGVGELCKALNPENVGGGANQTSCSREELARLAATNRTPPVDSPINSPELVAMMTCIGSKIPKALITSNPNLTNFGSFTTSGGMSVFTFDNAHKTCNVTRGKPLCDRCSHTLNSCHYGGPSGYGAMAVDYAALDGPLLQQIRDLVRSGQCGAYKRAACENNAGEEVACGSATHVHISTGSCNADAGTIEY